MDHAPDCAAGSTNPSAQLWRVERCKRYGGIPVLLTRALCVYDDALDLVTRKTITSNAARPELFIHRSIKSGSARANKSRAGLSARSVPSARNPPSPRNLSRRIIWISRRHSKVAPGCNVRCRCATYTFRVAAVAHNPPRTLINDNRMPNAHTRGDFWV